MLELKYVTIQGSIYPSSIPMSCPSEVLIPDVIQPGHSQREPQHFCLTDLQLCFLSSLQHPTLLASPPSREPFPSFSKDDLLLLVLFTQTLFFRRSLISSQCFWPFGPLFYTVNKVKKILESALQNSSHIRFSRSLHAKATLSHMYKVGEINWSLKWSL